MLAAMTAPAHAQKTVEPTNTVSQTELTRQISLADVGFLDGIEFRQLSGSTTLYFPVGPREAVTSAHLSLTFRHGRTLEVERHLTILIDDRIAHVERVEDVEGTGEIIVEIPPEAIRDGFVKVGIEYSGANSEKICVDERASGDFISISPNSGLRTNLDVAMLDSPADVATIMPRPKVVDASTAADDLDQAGFVMQASAVYDGEYGLVSLAATGTDAGVWSAGALQLDADGSAGAAISVARDAAGQPALLFTGRDALLGMHLLESDWRRLAREKGTRTLTLGRQARNMEFTTFQALGATPEMQLVSGSSSFQIPFASADFPTGRQPKGLDLLLSATRTPEGRGVTVSVFLNDTLLGNRPVNEGGPVNLDFSVPKGLVGRDNQLLVFVQRQTEGGNCMFAPQGYPVQVLPESRFLLGDASDAGHDFFLMRQLFGEGVALVLAPGTDTGAVLPWLAVLGGALLPDNVRLDIAETIEAAARPFIYVGPDAPAGTEPAVRFDQGAVVIRASDGSTLYEGEGIDDIGLVQIISVNGEKGIWIRPGAGGVPELGMDRPLILDRGNFAIIDDKGLVVAASSDRSDLVQVVYPDRVSMAQLFAKYRPWIIGAAWLLITALIVRFLLSLYRSRQAGS